MLETEVIDNAEELRVLVESFCPRGWIDQAGVIDEVVNRLRQDLGSHNYRLTPDLVHSRLTTVLQDRTRDHIRDTCKPVSLLDSSLVDETAKQVAEELTDRQTVCNNPNLITDHWNLAIGHFILELKKYTGDLCQKFAPQLHRDVDAIVSDTLTVIMGKSREKGYDPRRGSQLLAWAGGIAKKMIKKRRGAKNVPLGEQPEDKQDSQTSSHRFEVPFDPTYHDAGYMESLVEAIEEEAIEAVPEPLERAVLLGLRRQESPRQIASRLKLTPSEVYYLRKQVRKLVGEKLGISLRRRKLAQRKTNLMAVTAVKPD